MNFAKIIEELEIELSLFICIKMLINFSKEGFYIWVARFLFKGFNLMLVSLYEKNWDFGY